MTTTEYVGSSVAGERIVDGRSARQPFVVKQPSFEQSRPETRLGFAPDASRDAWWYVDVARGRVVLSPRVQTMFGVSPKSSFGLLEFCDSIHADDRKRVSAAYFASTDPERRAPFDIDFRIISKEDGVLRWVGLSGRGAFRESGACRRLVGAAFDVIALMLRRGDTERDA